MEENPVFKGNFNQQVLKSLFEEIKRLTLALKENKDKYALLALSNEPDSSEKSDEWFDGYRTACCEIAALIRSENHQ